MRLRWGSAHKQKEPPRLRCAARKDPWGGIHQNQSCLVELLLFGQADLHPRIVEACADPTMYFKVRDSTCSAADLRTQIHKVNRPGFSRHSRAC
jgi:hypothetical protein